MPMGLGISNTFNLRYKPMMQTVVPCDMVVNAILVVSMVVSNNSEPSLKIYHCSSAKSALMDFYAYGDDAADYLKYNPYDSALSEDIGFKAAHGMEAWLRYKRFKYDIPSKAMQMASKIPFIGG